ncbi:MAG TPA: ATP-binding protein [Acholeplasmataceae bacterium]|nr:ATP-binding protein [Acholeplasmataceae bacterium]
MEKLIENIKNEILKDKEIVNFIRKHKISEELFLKYINVFYQQKLANDICNACLGKKPCEMDVYEMQSKLEYNYGTITRKYIHCPYLDKVNEDFLEMLFFPETQITGKIFDTPERLDVINAINEYMQNPKENKGIFIHGAFGTGKTFILLWIAKQLAKLKLKVVFVYYPDLVRHIKSSIVNNKVEDIVNKLKTADVLMLDDIGGENNTNYIRDEVLGPILQYRMLGNMPTFMTSNYNIDQLGIHFMETKTEVDQIKSMRIIDRIKFMMKVVELIDKNYRLN